MLKVLSIPVFSLLLSACGGGGSDRVTPDRISKYNGDWQTVCSYDSETQLSSIDTLYITDTEYTFFTDVFCITAKTSDLLRIFVIIRSRSILPLPLFSKMEIKYLLLKSAVI